MKPRRNTAALADLPAELNPSTEYLRSVGGTRVTSARAARGLRPGTTAGHRNSVNSPMSGSLARDHLRPAPPDNPRTGPRGRPRPQAAQLHPESWMDSHGDVLYRFALARMCNLEVAEEVVQETFLAALSNRAQFTGRSDERTWLVGILRRKIADHYRSRHRPATIRIRQATELDTLGRAQQREVEARYCTRGATAATEDKEFWAISVSASPSWQLRSLRPSSYTR